MSEGTWRDGRPVLALCGFGGLLALGLALHGLLPMSDFGVKRPLDLIKFVFLLAPVSPFLLVAGGVFLGRSRYLWVVALVLVLSCAVYPFAQAEYRNDASMLALTYLVVPFLQLNLLVPVLALLTLVRTPRP